jgi:hypothetical protein
MNDSRDSMLKEVLASFICDTRFTKETMIGLANLRRYFELIIFQAYLQSIEPDTMLSFPTIETYVKERPGEWIDLCCDYCHSKERG